MAAKKYIEIIWHGRGGQGAITASQIVAETAFKQGYKGITTAPSFGAERRGAPVMAFLRISNEEVRSFSRITMPDIAVILDPSLLPILKLSEALPPETIIICNSAKEPKDLGLDYFHKVGLADVTKVAMDNNLTMAGVAILNTPILGAFVKTTEIINLEELKSTIFGKFGDKKGELNFLTAQITWENTKVYNHN